VKAVVEIARSAAGDAQILVHARSPASADGPPNHVSLSVSELDETCTALRSGGLRLLVEPRDYPWGRSAYLRHPDVRLVELTPA
jgi:hypothetical protein